MNNLLTIKKTSVLHGTTNLLPASKSISNRALIINALAGGGSSLQNLSTANDTQLMLRLINSPEKIIDIEDAGTTMRFLTAYFAVTNQNKILTGTERMKERPIGILVDALRELGAEINFLEKEGYPPVEVNRFIGQQKNKLYLRGDVSSQYISALMMVAPILPQGLTLVLTGKIASLPYIKMTASLMRQFGANVDLLHSSIVIPNHNYKPTAFTVESDWSGASYWFAFVALASEAEIKLPQLSYPSIQGDSTIMRIMEPLGVKASLEGNVLILTKAKPQQEVTCNFTHCPDLAQTVAVVCAAKGIKAEFTGLESLRIKETDRIAALQQELDKIGASLIEKDTTHWVLAPSRILPSSVTIETYHDHRMAMAFAPLATRMDITIKDPSVVKKSYPAFWEDVESVGINLELL